MKLYQNKRLIKKYKRALMNSINLVMLRDNLKHYERLNI